MRVVDFEWESPDRAYPVAQIEALPGGETTEVQTARQPIIGMVRKVARARARLGAQLPKAVVDSLVALEDAALFADVVSYTLVEDFQEKQRLLETLDVNERLARLHQLLAAQLTQLELWKKLQGNLPNKHVGHN